MRYKKVYNSFMKQKKPTMKQKIWLTEYLKDFNATRAASVAFDTKNPRNMGHKMIKNPFMKEQISLKADEILGPIEKDLMANVQFWVNMRDDEDARKSDRLKASEYLAKYRGLFKDNSTLNANVSVTISDDI